MDSLGDLIPFALAAVYLFLKFARRRPRPAAPPPRATKPRAAPSTTGPTPFEQLLARLEAGLNETGRPTAAPPTTRSATRLVAGRPESAMFAESRAARAASEAQAVRATAFHSLERPAAAGQDSRGGFDREARGFEQEQADFAHAEHGFGDANPLSEPAFEAAPDADRRRALPNRMGYDPHARAAPPAPTPRDPLVARLRDATALREAFVLSTVLDRRPGSRRLR